MGVWAVIWWRAKHLVTAVTEVVSTSKPSDPRLTFATPYRNVRPEVAYVGSDSCTSCHPSEAATYAQHPMGRSAAYVSGPGPGERFDRSTKNPFEALGLEFHVEPRGQHVVHQEIRRDAKHAVVTTLEADVLMEIGSGTQGRSYVINRDGYFFQSPISWFTDTHSWGLSPGFGELAIHFRRPVTVQCLFCHIDQITPLANRNGGYATPLPRHLVIGCERCHGPGQLHVKRRVAGEPFDGIDDTIVNPSDLEPSLREAVCQQCHLLGEERIMRRGRTLFDYRPGLPLHEILSAFVRPPELVESHKTVGHVEAMYQSRCFRESRGPRQLGCISCHDPHRLPAPAERVAFFRQRCLNCHEVRPSGAVVTKAGKSGRPDSPSLTPRHSPTDNCIECHMPRRSSANVAHAASTDHRIVRWADRPPELPPESLSGIQPGQIPLVDFYRDLHDPRDPEVLRDLGLAMTSLAPAQGSEAVSRQICVRALPFLERAVRADPDDLDALEAKGYSLWVCGDARGALAAYEGVLAKAPERAYSLDKAAHIAAELGRDESAITYYRRLLAVNPWNPDDHYLLAKLLGQHNDWPATIPELRASLRLDPNQVAARMLLVAAYFQTGDKQRARQEFEIVERLKPQELERLRGWFREQER
jgi:cytochrome c-type biogenesis protein CcmH/NrfG